MSTSDSSEISSNKEMYFLSSEIENSPREKAFFHVIPAPLEASVSYGGGTALGPAAILRASDQLEVWDGFSRPCDEGIHTVAAIQAADAPACISAIEKEVGISLSMGGIPVLLGGEHTVSLGAAKAVFEKYGDKACLVQIDAHADLRNNYEGNPYSHASVVRKIHEYTGWKIFQIGIRGWCEEEQTYQQENGIDCITGRQAAEANVNSIKLPACFPEFLYITVDVDGLDSSIMPATGTPVPGGLGWYQTLGILESLCRQRRVVGFDCVELAPRQELPFCDFTAAQLVYNIMGMVQRSQS